jgi:hypothetical protein
MKYEGADSMKPASKMPRFRLLMVTLLLGSTFNFNPAFSQPEMNPADLSPVELVEEPAEPTPSNDNDQSSGSTIPSVNTPLSPPVILTTRPSFTDAWLTVPQGSFQSENGVTYTDNSNETRSWVLPETLLKLGLTNHTELRFSVPNYTYLRDDDEGVLSNNLGDISVGLSHHRALPGKIDLAVIPFLNIPTGANKVSSNSLDPQLRLVVARYLTPKLVVASQFDTRWNTGKNAPANVVFNPTGIAYYSFTDKLSGFLEYGGFIPTSGKTQQYVQTGALYLLTKRQQIDARIAVGLNRNSSDIIVGVGYSFRIDGLFGTSREYATFRRPTTR